MEKYRNNTFSIFIVNWTFETPSKWPFFNVPIFPILQIALLYPSIHIFSYSVLYFILLHSFDLPSSELNHANETDRLSPATSFFIIFPHSVNPHTIGWSKRDENIILLLRSDLLLRLSTCIYRAGAYLPFLVGTSN